MTLETSTEDRAESQARAQVASIVAMVAALNVDYDRLEELRESRRHPDIGTSEDWAQDNPEDAAELAELEDAAGNCESEDDARERILEDALSIEVRGDWHTPGERIEEPTEFRIVLCTGGPHVELLGDLNEHCEPSRVRVLYRDWGASGELFDFDRDAVLTYCQQYYFGQ